MKKNEELFYLIKSLSKSEKRYFKINSLGNDDAEYVLLFNAIETQNEYNEALIKEQFKEKAFVNQLTTIKNYLKQRILQSLRNYHSKISVKAELIDILRNVEILFHKGLYTICDSELKRAEKKAENYEQDLLLFQIKDWKRKIHIALHPKDIDTLKIIVTDQKNTLNSTTEYNNLLLANIDPVSYSISNKKSHLLQNKTLKTLHAYKKLLAAGKTKKAKQTIEELLKEWEQYPELLKEYFATYFSVCNNYLEHLVFEKMYKEAFVRILLLKQKIKDTGANSATITNETLHLYTIEIGIHKTLKDLHNTEEIIDDILLFIAQNKTLISNAQILTYKFQFAVIYLQKKDYTQVLRWTHNIQDNHSKKDSSDLIVYTYWLQLIAYYELKEKAKTKQLIYTLKKILKKEKNIVAYELILFQFLAKTIEYPEKEKKEAFSQLHLTLQNNFIPKAALLYFNFYEWTQDRIR